MAIKIKEKTASEIAYQEERRLLEQDFFKNLKRVFYYEVLLPGSMDKETALLAKYCYLLIKHITDIANGTYDFFRNDYIRANYLDVIDSCLVLSKPNIIAEIMALYDQALVLFEKKKVEPTLVKQLFIDAVKPYLLDFQRSDIAHEEHVMSSGRLKQHLSEKFTPLVDMMFIALGEKHNAASFPVLTLSQGILYSLDELERDWKRGTINISHEDLESANLELDASYEEVINNPYIIRYYLTQIEEILPQLSEFKKQIEKMENRETRRMCRNMYNNMMEIIKKFEPWLKQKHENVKSTNLSQTEQESLL